MKQKLYTLTAILLLSLFVGNGLWAQTSGTLNDAITWTLSDDGVLTITGSGDMPDYAGSTTSPWASNENIKEVVFKGEITKIGSYSFNLCKSITKVTLPATLKTIGSSAFYYCNFAENGINLPESLEQIGNNAFSTCSLSEINIPEGVKSISEDAFGNNNLTSITIPSTVISLGTTICYGSNDIATIKVEEANTVYTSRDSEGKECNAIFRIADNTLQEGCKNTIIPANITAIGDAAFMTCHELTSITIPNTVKTIGKQAFDRCNKMTEITIGSGVTEMGDEVFNGCYELQKIVFLGTTAPTFAYETFSGLGNAEYTFYIPANSAVSYANKWKVINFMDAGNPITRTSSPRMYVEVNEKDRNNITLTMRYDTLFPDKNYIMYYDIAKDENFPNIEDSDIYPIVHRKSSIDCIIIDESVKDYRPTDCSNWFKDYTDVTAINGLANLNTSEVTDMSYMFYNANSLTTLDLSSFDTAEVTDMSHMFDGASNLTSVDLSSFNTAKVLNMTRMFYGVKSLKDIYVSDDFTTSGLTNDTQMFAGDKFIDKIGGKEKANYTTGYFLKKVGTLGGQPLGAKGAALNIDDLDLSSDADYVLTETAPVTASTATYTRAMSSKWGTLCLPYAFTVTDNSANFYTMATVGTNVITLNPLTGTIQAGTPVIFQANGNEVTFSAKNVALAQTAGTGEQLVGTFATQEVPSDAYFIAKDAFHLASAYSTGDYKGVKTKGFRAYLQPSTPQGSLLRIATGGTTGIDSSLMDDLNNSAAEYYNMDGTRTSGLHRGLNIIKVGGKTRKIMVK